MDIPKIIADLVGRLNPTPKVHPVTGGNPHETMTAVHKDYHLSTHNGETLVRADHSFGDLKDMAAWLNREATVGRWNSSDSVVLVGDTRINALADADEQISPAATCPLTAHPYWMRWLHIEQAGWINTGDLLEALREVEPTFGTDTVRVDGEPCEVDAGPGILAGLRSISVSDSGGVDVERDGGGMAVASTRTGKTTVRQELRERWPLVLPVFGCAEDVTAPIEAVVSWRYDKSAEDMMWRIRLPLASIARRKARIMLADRLREAMPGVMVGVGEVKTRSGRLK